MVFSALIVSPSLNKKKFPHPTALSYIGLSAMREITLFKIENFSEKGKILRQPRG
jgi:hypothetical protein